MMSDINEPSQSKGRGDLGGNPAGVVSAETFRWWTRNVEGNPDSIIISVHHYMLKNTTVASGEWEGLRRNENGTLEQHYHGYKPEGAPKGASYLHFVGGIPDAHAFEDYLEAHPGSIDLWLGGHTHTHPEDNYGGKRHIETRWGVHFMNVAAITKYHGKTSCPMSRHLTFQSGSDEVLVRCFLHDSDFAPKGWYAPAERKIKLSKAFQSDTATIQRGMNR
jgi:hypothetical protein